MKRCLLVINPNAGGGQSVEELKRQLLAAVRPYQDLELVDLGVLVPDSVADMTDRLRSRLPVLDCVVVAGGDGTIADVINAMLEASAGRVAADRLPVLGIIPVGTGNRLANHLNLPLSFKRAWKAILMGATCPLDLGMVTVSALHGGHGGHGGDRVSRYFSLMAGAGIDAQIIENVRSVEKKHLGLFAYIWQGAMQAFTTPYAFFDITIDDKPTLTVKGIGATVANAANLLGEVLTLSPGSRTDDGLLDVCVIASKQRLDYWTTVVQMLMHQHSLAPDKPLKEGLSHFRGKHITITSRPRLKVQADGDVIGRTPATMTIVPQAIQVCVPTAEVMAVPLIEPLYKTAETLRYIIDELTRQQLP